MYHSFFIYSSINEHLGCFHVLAIVNSDVINIGVHVSLFCSMYAQQGCTLFFIVAVLVCIPTSSVRGFPFLQTLSSIYFLWTFGSHHSDWCEMVPYCDFDLHFSDNE